MFINNKIHFPLLKIKGTRAVAEKYENFSSTQNLMDLYKQIPKRMIKIPIQIVFHQFSRHPNRA